MGKMSHEVYQDFIKEIAKEARIKVKDVTDYLEHRDLVFRTDEPMTMLELVDNVYMGIKKFKKLIIEDLEYTMNNLE